MSLNTLNGQPLELLVKFERRARAAMAERAGLDARGDEWQWVEFHLGLERFVVERSSVREILPLSEPVIRVPRAKPWLRGVANVRGQLLTIVDLKMFLGGGISMPDSRTQVMVVVSREIATGLMVDEVTGFRRFDKGDFKGDIPDTVMQCEDYLDGVYRDGFEAWTSFNLLRLLEDQRFLSAGEEIET